MVHSRDKGKKGETEFINQFGSLFPNPIKRNLDQTRDGGADVTGCEPFVIEIKRVEKLQPNIWWTQVTRAASGTPLKDTIPIVAYRQSRQPWRFLLPASLIVPDPGFVIATPEVFIKLVTSHYEKL